MSKRAVHLRPRSLLSFACGDELLDLGAVHWILAFEDLDILEERLSCIVICPHGRELIRSARRTILGSGLNYALCRVGQGGEEVCRCLSVRAVIPQIEKILLCLIGRAKVDESTFVQEGDFIEGLRAQGPSQLWNFGTLELKERWSVN